MKIIEQIYSLKEGQRIKNHLKWSCDAGDTIGQTWEAILEIILGPKGLNC